MNQLHAIIRIEASDRISSQINSDEVALRFASTDFGPQLSLLIPPSLIETLRRELEVIDQELTRRVQP